MLHGKVILLTGASAGIGQAFAARLKDEGYHVYGTTRRKPQGEKVPGKDGGFLQMLQMDVVNEEQIAAAVETIVKEEGRLDILINCAGIGIVGSVEDTSYEEMKLQMDTNFAGVHNTCRAVLPVMRKQNKGFIINISSMGSLCSIPFQGFYSISKAAVDVLTEVIWMEARPFGIKCCSIQPGDFKTRFTDSRIYTKNGLENEAYFEAMMKAVYSMELSELDGDDLSMICDLLMDVLETEEPAVHIPVGTGCPERAKKTKVEPIEETLKARTTRYADAVMPPESWLADVRTKTLK
ncbi:SDR family oxidoreductase [Clostridia bacterium OttesenSCG-928-F22]|nr:SDR family oxidoreductase [Clostridia bacterium OttesenSCG-928-F22]